MNNETILQVEHVNLWDDLGIQVLLKEINFAIKKGDRWGIIGASGAGKTTLLKLLNRLVEPTSGLLQFNNKPFHNYPVTELRQQIVLVSQEPKLLGMTVKDALIYPLKLKRLSEAEIKTRFLDYCDLFAIPDDWLERNELQLSVGQRQWVTIVRGLMMQPSILLLDEPTSALDIGLSHRLMEQLITLSEQQQLTVIMVNHQWSWVRQFAQNILILDNGKIQQKMATIDVNWQGIQQQLIQPKEQDEWDV